jgi:hypothetical protein
MRKFAAHGNPVEIHAIAGGDDVAPDSMTRREVTSLARKRRYSILVGSYPVCRS